MVTVLVDLHHDTGAIERVSYPAERTAEALVVRAGELAPSVQIAVVAGVTVSADEPADLAGVVRVDLVYTLPMRTRTSLNNRIGVKRITE